jgi:hypothetical protein
VEIAAEALQAMYSLTEKKQHDPHRPQRRKYRQKRDDDDAVVVHAVGAINGPTVMVLTTKFMLLVRVTSCAAASWKLSQVIKEVEFFNAVQQLCPDIHVLCVRRW